MTQNPERKHDPQAVERAQSAEERNRQAAAERVLLRQGVEWIEDRRGRPSHLRRSEARRPG